MNKTVESDRTLYIPSDFAKESLIYLQEIGQSKTLEKHTNARSKLDSFLLFIVLDGTGILEYNETKYKMSKGSCAFINCNNKYSHTSDNWTIKWIHFNGSNSKYIYDKYISRNGLNSFKTKQFNKYNTLLDETHTIAKSNDYMRDMYIYEKLVSLLSMIMTETIYGFKENTKRLYDVKEIKDYLDDNYLKEISLDSLSNRFYINKYYLTRLFKTTYGVTINNYMLNKRITIAKEMLRFSNKSVDEIANDCGISDSNYFSRTFKKIEGITPKEYRKIW